MIRGVEIYDNRQCILRLQIHFEMKCVRQFESVFKHLHENREIFEKKDLSLLL